LNNPLKLGVNPKSRCIKSPALYGVTEGTGRETDNLVMKFVTFFFCSETLSRHREYMNEEIKRNVNGGKRNSAA